jgi:hypothetical protein
MIATVSWTRYASGSAGSKVMHDATRSLGAALYHRLEWRYAKEIFANSRLRLSPIQSWRDPYERWWCEVLFGPASQLGQVNAYALCWTTSKFDEPAWRMAGYGKAEPIVRVRCDIESVLKAAKHQIDREAGAWFLGTVKYKRTKDLLLLAKQVGSGRFKDVARTAATMLIHKRNAFQFEKEVRLVFLNRGPPRHEVFLPIRPDAITQVMTSPYASPDKHRTVVEQLRPFGIKPIKSGVLNPPVWTE